MSENCDGRDGYVKYIISHLRDDHSVNEPLRRMCGNKNNHYCSNYTLVNMNVITMDHI